MLKTVITGKKNRFHIFHKVRSSYSNFFRSGSALRKGFSTSAMTSKLLNLSLNDGIALNFLPPWPLSLKSLKSMGTTVQGKTKESSILPPTTANNAHLDQILNRGQT